MRLPVALIAVVVAGSAPAAAESPVAKAMCDKIAPQMLEFVAAIPTIVDGLAASVSKMTSEEQLRFQATEDRSKDMLKAAEDFRAAFLTACFGF